MSTQSTIPLSTIVSSTTSFLGGGFLGAVFTWYMNHPGPTILTYEVNTTILASPAARSLIPELKVQVKNDMINSLYAHSIELDVPQGPYADKAELAITLPKGTSFFGFEANSPTVIHDINCLKIIDGVRCSLSPLSPKVKGYRVVLATGQAEAPRVILAAKNIELMNKEEYINKYGGFWGKFLTLRYVGLAIALILYLLFGLLLLRKIRQLMISAKKTIITGKIMDEEGHPVEGAHVEVSLASENRVWGPLLTDSAGDFIIGGLTKQANFSGHLRVSRDGYSPSESELKSPIVVQTLRKKFSSIKSDG